MISDTILSTIAELVSLYDGIAEPAGEQAMTVLLAPNIAKALNLPEEVTLATRADIPDSYFVSYNSELLEHFSRLLQDRGIVTAWSIKFSGHLKKTGFEQLLSKSLVPQNGLIRFQEAKPAITPYLWCNVAYQAEADEQRIGMVDLVINELTGVAPVDIGDALFWEADRTSISEPPEGDRLVHNFELGELIERVAAELIKDQLTNWSAKLNRAKNRDEQRLKDYYGTIMEEIRSKIKSKGLVDEEKEKELARIEATQGELERKLLDLQDRYAMKVEAYLHSAMVLYLPTVHIKCELVRKKAKRIVPAVWNPFTKIIEPWRCEVSGEPVTEFYLGDKDAKIISPNCWDNK
ncbi:MAG: hypothetical protein EBE86_017115 [Hormoscilla sp. GUM202]|nr:hypothetical protein [Hormoscilla sp. GUM202]